MSPQSGFLEECAPRVARPCSTLSVPGSIGSVDAFSFSLPDIDLTDYVLGYDLPFGGEIAALRITCTEGAGKVTLLINNVPVTGIIGVDVTGIRSQYLAIDNATLSPGDDITLRIDSGSNDLANVRGTVVLADRSIQPKILSPISEIGLISGQLKITGPLVGFDYIPLVIAPGLTKRPSIILPPVFEKPDPNSNNIFCVGIDSVIPDDDTGLYTGWNYNLNANSIDGYVMHYAFYK